MALRNQPYLPLYIQDIMTDEKLNECSASTHGIYIKGIMCLMHKSEEYGKILLKQKYKQNKSMCLNFAYQLVKHLPYSVEEIEKAIIELINEKVCYFDGDYLCQKRMIRDNEISEARSKAGKKGGGNPSFVKTKLQTKPQTNSENEYEYINTLIKELMSFFNFNEIKNPDKQSQSYNFFRNLIAQNKVEYFTKQFIAYQKYKERADEKKHSFNSFIGTHEGKFLDGGWNSRNWIEELKDMYKEKKSKLPPEKGYER